MPMSRKGGAAVAEKPRAVSRKSPVSIIHPSEKETVSHSSYTFQIAVARPAQSVEVCIDGGDWRPCREALGLWWCDWEGYHASEHGAVARLRMPDGAVEMSEPRIFEVALP